MKIDFLFEKIDSNHYFISNESGTNLIISKKEFLSIVSNKIKPKLIEKLYKKNIIIGKKNEWRYLTNYKKLKRFIFNPPTLHIVVLTTKCNHSCVYCRAKPLDSNQTNMEEKTVFKVIDFIFSTPSYYITVEFQGGEALINWDAFKKAVMYIKEKQKKIKKDIVISIVTNFSLMTKEKLKFMIENNISICTSLDGPSYIHNKNRLYTGGDSYFTVTKWLKTINNFFEKRKGYKRDSLPSALMTTTRISLKYPHEIIEEYRKLGLGGIFIRPLSPIGYAKHVWDKIGYTAEEFIKFYEKSINYILKINKKETFIERNAAIKLKKILFNEDPNYLDLRSPCGAVIGQLSYYPNGHIYSCDEGRMTNMDGEKFFKIGNVFKDSYEDILSYSKSKNVIYSSINDNYPKCVRCAFKPYCGVCPVFNYTVKDTLINLDYSNYWCDIEKGIFKVLINKIKEEKYLKIFMRWFDA